MKKAVKIILFIAGGLGVCILILLIIIGINQLVVILKEQGDRIGSGEINKADNPYTGEDWTGWRGPYGNGITIESGWVYDAEKTSVLWEQNVGKGFSSPSVADGKVYISGNTKKKDTVYCLDLLNGTRKWAFSYDCPPGTHAGPRASPLLHDGLLYTVSRKGGLYCLDAETGKKIWSVDIAGQYNIPPNKWGYACSPEVYMDLIIINAGKGGIAFHKKTGKLVWQNGKGWGEYSSPVLYKQGEQTCALLFTGSKLVSVDAETGKILWEYPWVVIPPVNASDPLIVGTKIFISSYYSKGCALIDFSSGLPETLWANKNMGSHFTSFYHKEGYIYGFDGTPLTPFLGEFRCLDMATGAIVWKEKLGFGSFIVADNTFIIILQPGTIKFAEVNHEEYRELSSLKIKRDQFWTPPVLSHGILLLRSLKGVFTAVSLRG